MDDTKDLTFMTDASPGNINIIVLNHGSCSTMIRDVDLELLNNKCPKLVRRIQWDGERGSYTFTNHTASAVVSFLRYVYIDDYMMFETGIDRPYSLLKHLQIYQLAESLEMLQLTDMVRDYIIDEAERFRVSESPMQDFLEGIMFLYTDLREAQDLRRILTFYIIKRFHHFGFAQDLVFISAVYESPLLHRDLQQANLWTNFTSSDAGFIIGLRVCNHEDHKFWPDFICEHHINFPGIETSGFATALHFQQYPTLFPSTPGNPRYAVGIRHAGMWDEVVNPSPGRERADEDIIRWHEEDDLDGDRPLVLPDTPFTDLPMASGSNQAIERSAFNFTPSELPPLAGPTARAPSVATHSSIALAPPRVPATSPVAVPPTVLSLSLPRSIPFRPAPHAAPHAPIAALRPTLTPLPAAGGRVQFLIPEKPTCGIPSGPVVSNTLAPNEEADHTATPSMTIPSPKRRHHDDETANDASSPGNDESGESSSFDDDLFMRPSLKRRCQVSFPSAEHANSHRPISTPSSASDESEWSFVPRAEPAIAAGADNASPQQNLPVISFDSDSDSEMNWQEVIFSSD